MGYKGKQASTGAAMWKRNLTWDYRSAGTEQVYIRADLERL